MEKPKNVIVAAVGALALALWAGLSACSQQPGNQTQQSTQQQPQSGDQQQAQPQAQQPQSAEQQGPEQPQSGEQQVQHPQSGDQQQARQPQAQQPQSAEQQGPEQPQSGEQQVQQPQSGEQQQAQQPQSGEQQQAERPQSGQREDQQPQSGERQHAQQPQDQNNNRQIASTGQNETGTLNLNRDQIEQVQRALNQKGFKAGRADGKMGQQTESALRSFQQQQKLEASGQIDQQTLAALGLNNLTQSTAGQGSGQQSAPRQQ